LRGEAEENGESLKSLKKRSSTFFPNSTGPFSGRCQEKLNGRAGRMRVIKGSMSLLAKGRYEEKSRGRGRDVKIVMGVGGEFGLGEEWGKFG